MLDIHDTLRRNHARCQGYQDAVAGDPRCTYFGTTEELREYNTGWKKGRAAIAEPSDDKAFALVLVLYGVALVALVSIAVMWW